MQKGNANGKMVSFCGLSECVGMAFPILKLIFGLHFSAGTTAFNILWLLALLGLSNRFEVPFLFFVLHISIWFPSPRRVK